MSNTQFMSGGVHVHRGLQRISRLTGRRKNGELYRVIYRYSQRTNVVVIRNDQPLLTAPKMRPLKHEINYFGPVIATDAE
jgi:hypothetical protein